MSKPLPKNESFVKLYGGRSSPYDLTLQLHGDSHKCHQFVLQQSAVFLREAMKANQQRNMQSLGERLGSMTLRLPDWVSKSALDKFIRFSYTTEFEMTHTSSSSMRRERPKEALDLLRLACYVCDEALQECLIAREIIPNMNAYSALLFLQEVYNPPDHCKRQPGERALTFLVDYCMYYLAKNLPLILRQEKQKLLLLSERILCELLRDSMHYIVDGRADIEILMDFAAGVFGEKDLFTFFWAL